MSEGGPLASSFDDLNPEQREVALHEGGPLVVLAGPGTGKTFAIIARVRHLIERGVEPASILVVTFTVKAAGELRERLAKAVGARAAENVQAQTFHGFGRSVLRRFGDMIGLRRELVIMDSAQQKRLLRRLVRADGLFASRASEGVDAPVEESRRFIAQCRHAARFPEDAARFAAQWVERANANELGLKGEEIVAERYQNIEKLCAVEDEGIEGVICGRAIYSGDLDFAAAQARADELNG